MTTSVMAYLGLMDRRRVGAWVRCTMLSLCLGNFASAAPAPWTASPYSYFADDSRLETVLAEFASGFNLSLSIQPGVTGAVNGRFTASSPTEFLSRLAGVYGFAWYTHAGVLHVSKASEVIMRSVPLPAGGVANLRSTLTDLGVVEPRFGWGELPDHDILMISGPASYVALIEETMRQLPSGGSRGRHIRVFRLLHASAEDRVIAYRDQQIRQAGLATVLRSMLGAGGGPATVVERVAASQSPVESAPGLRAPGATPVSPVMPRPRTDEGRSGARSGPSIQSDPRLNALIVSDSPEMMATYERLIAELDIPSALIEIEAMIIDINTERAKELGVNWRFRAGGISVNFEGGTVTSASAGSGTTSGGSTLPADAGDRFVAEIRMLESTGDARIQSRPSVLTSDNIGALLDLSETFYVRVQSERAANLTPVTAGTTLKVTPRRVGGDHPSIHLTVDIEDGQIQDRKIDSLPTVRRSSVSTQAVVRQGETLMIAGYTSDQSLEYDQKIPVLGDLPVVGALFSSKARTIQRRERVFLIRPKVVEPGGAPLQGAPSRSEP